MPLQPSLHYLSPLLDFLVELTVEDAWKGLNENGAESDQEQRRRKVQANESLPPSSGSRRCG
jgi:hypothetical protein